MNSPSSITFNVGAPTFGVRWLCHRFCGVTRTTAFPIWNGVSCERSMNLKTSYLVKPSSNTLNVGAPTLLTEFVHFDPFRTLAGLKPSGYKAPLFVGAGLQPGQPALGTVVAR
jgi:hypothetical protein